MGKGKRKDNLEFGINRETTMCKIISKYLEYSTVEYIQYPIMTYSGKLSEKEYTYIYMCVCVYTFMYICIYN